MPIIGCYQSAQCLILSTVENSAERVTVFFTLLILYLYIIMVLTEFQSAGQSTTENKVVHLFVGLLPGPATA